MANRQRNIQLKVWVNEEEKELIELKMAQLQTNKMGAYIRKMAIDGFVIYLDTENIKQMNNELSATNTYEAIKSTEKEQKYFFVMI